MSELQRYKITLYADKGQHPISLNGLVVGSVTRVKQDENAVHPYNYTAVLHDTPEQDGRSRSGYQFTDVVKRLLEGSSYYYESEYLPTTLN